MENLNTDKIFESLSNKQQAMFEELVACYDFKKVGKKSTICILTLGNGMEIIGQSQCVSPEAYDYFLGAKHALMNAIDKQLADIWAYQAHSLNGNHPDAQRLDFLQELTDETEFTGKVIMRDSTTGRGWRLHETSSENAVEDVRTAIDNYMTHQQ